MISPARSSGTSQRLRSKQAASTMGTFHDDKSELHGITVVVETEGSELFVGRCDDEDGERVILLDADRFSPESDDGTAEEYLEKASRFGVWKKFDRLVIPRGRVLSIRRLGELA